MTEPHSKTRQAADAFRKAQSQFIARKRLFEEIDQIVVARDEKTVRLREARLANEALKQLKPSQTAKRASKA